MIEITNQNILEFVLLFIFLLAVVSYASYIFGSGVTRAEEREISLKKLNDLEFELAELFDLENEVIKLELNEKISELELSLLKSKWDASRIAKDWVESQPDEPYAYWNLAKTYETLEEYELLKETLSKLLKKHSNFDSYVEEWLAETNEKLSELELKPTSTT
jgi:hypothetical protein